MLELLTTFCKNQVDPLDLILSDPADEINEGKMGMVRRSWRQQEQFLQQLTQILEASEEGEMAKVHLDQMVACSQNTSLRMNRNTLLLLCRDVLQKLRQTKYLVLLLPHVRTSVHENDNVYMCSKPTKCRLGSLADSEDSSEVITSLPTELVPDDPNFATGMTSSRARRALLPLGPLKALLRDVYTACAQAEVPSDGLIYDMTRVACGEELLWHVVLRSGQITFDNFWEHGAKVIKTRGLPLDTPWRISMLEMSADYASRAVRWCLEMSKELPVARWCTGLQDGIAMALPSPCVGV